jgi:hypothetical protein
VALTYKENVHRLSATVALIKSEKEILTLVEKEKFYYISGSDFTRCSIVVYIGKPKS